MCGAVVLHMPSICDGMKDTGIMFASIVACARLSGRVDVGPESIRVCSHALFWHEG